LRAEEAKVVPAAGTARAATTGTTPSQTEKSAARAITSPKPVASTAPTNADSSPTTTVRGEVKSQAHYAVWLEGAGRYPVGRPATLQAVLVAKSPFKCNDKYPYKLVLDAPPAGVTFPSGTVRSMSVTKSRGTMSVPFAPTTPGTKTISGTLSFSVCTDEKCLIEKQHLAISVAVGDS
jgi:hypothetical protein